MKYNNKSEVKYYRVGLEDLENQEHLEYDEFDHLYDAIYTYDNYIIQKNRGKYLIVVLKGDREIILESEGYSGDFAMDKVFEKFGFNREEIDD